MLLVRNYLNQNLHQIRYQLWIRLLIQTAWISIKHVHASFLFHVVYPSVVTKTPDPPASTWKSRLEASLEEPTTLRFGISEEELQNLAHIKLPYFRTVKELKATKYDFRKCRNCASFVAFDNLFKVTKRTKNADQLTTEAKKPYT